MDGIFIRIEFLAVMNMALSSIDIAWAAGFLEGEGCFSRPSGDMMVSASQVQREPLKRLKGIFGGTIKKNKRENDNWQDVYTWWVTGRKAAQCMMTILCLMSPRRSERIVESLRTWKKKPLRQSKGDTRCIRGHDLTAQGAILVSKAGKYLDHRCRLCHNERSRIGNKKYYAMRNAERAALLASQP